DVSWFDTKEVAALPAEINDDLEKIQDAFGDKFGNGVMAASAFLGGFGCAFGMGWLIALVMCSILPFMGVGAAFMGKAVQEIQNESQSWYAKASAVVEECLNAMRTVVAFGGEHRELKKFSAALVETRRGGVKNGFKVGAGMGYTMMIVFLGYGLAFWFGMTLRYNDEINPATGEAWNPGTIMAIFFCIFIGSFMIGNLDPSLKAMKAAQTAAGRFFQAVENKPAIQCRIEDKRLDITSIEKFQFESVHFTYPARPDVKVLNGLSLTIERGQKVAVVGESGSGKSTVMALLERFYDPDSGAVLVNGQNMTSFKISALRKCIGYVGQEPVLFASSIRHNIMQGNPSASKEDFAKACSDANLSFVDNLPDKYNTFVGSGGGQLSGGQKQRIAIARALLKKASFLFLDEATSALDNTSEKMIQATIDSISATADGGLGIVSIAHRLSTVRNADLIYVLSRGTLVEKGNHASLMEKKGTYYALVAAQESSHKADEGDEAPPVPHDNTHAMVVKRSSTNSGDSETARVRKEKEAEAEREKEITKKYKVPMGRLLSYNKPEWPFFVPAVLGAMVDGSAMPVCTIALVGSMEGFFKTDKEEMRRDLELMSLIFVIIGVSAFVGSTISHGCFSILGEAMTQRLRVAILTGMFRQEVGFHDNPANTPGMLSKALELWAFRVATLCKSIQAKAAAMSSLVVGLVIAFVYCWQMSLVMLGSIPVMIAAQALQMLVLLGASKNENENITNANQIVVDSVMNARTVQALGVEKGLVGMYVGWVEKSLVGMWRRNILAGLGFGVSNGIMFFIMAGGFYVASFLIKEGVADFQGVMMAFMGIFYAGMGAGQAAVMVGDATKAKVACHDMFQLMDRVSAIDGLEPVGETPKELQAGQIEFSDVKFFYPFRPEVQVLKGITFRISAGQSVGLVGPSGGGKSTVMSLIQRFYDPQEGNVFIGSDRVALNTVNIRWWRRQIGFVGQEPILFNTTVRANILYGLDDGETVTDEYISQCEKMSNLAFLYKNGNKGLETDVGPRGSRLSGGQKQRVAICRALIRNPPVMLLDEATSALDTQSEAIVQKALEAAREGRTSFAIAHRLSTIQGCDVILVNADGRVVEKGNHDELMAMKGVYYKLQMQAQK
ncbi:ABCB1, partial [Symbiodinium pilosum]